MVPKTSEVISNKDFLFLFYIFLVIHPKRKKMGEQRKMKKQKAEKIER